ncbi:MAG: OmpA family protein [Pseudomonadota bacterium]
MNKRQLVGIACLVVVMGSAHAADLHGPSKGLYLSGFGHFYAPPDNTVLDDDLELGVGGGFGVAFTERFLGEINYLKSDHDVTGLPGDADTEQAWIDLIYKLESNGRLLTPYVVGSFGRMEAEPGQGLSRERENQAGLGLGFFHDLSQRFSLRGDVRGIYTNDGGGVQPFFKLGLTAALGAVNKSRGPVDSDGDGVYDADDRCPNTPAGTAVDATGCEPSGPGDADGDGVTDDIDRCPTTPAGVEVDSRGCALDGDGDGVPDYRDRCPDSERGARVDADGCYVELEQEVTIDMNLEFDTNSAALRTDHYREIQRVVDFLRQYPTANAVIEGHTDSSGAAAYNQSLSEKRASSVRDYLVNQAGVSADRLTARGFGETRPKASNDTAAGRQENRRVSAVVAGTQTVRQ